jgi:hypothetical protein
LERVHDHGADLLITFDGGSLTQFEDIFGLRSNGVREMQGTHRASFPFGELVYSGSREIYLESVGAEVLATNEEGNIVLARNAFGKGHIWFLNFALERKAFETLDGYDPAKNPPYYKVYELFAKDILAKKAVVSGNPMVGLTEIPDGDGLLVSAINYSEKTVDPALTLQNGYTVSEVLYGNLDSLGKCDGVIFRVKK